MDGDAHFWIGAPGDKRCQTSGIQGQQTVEFRVFISVQGLPITHRRLPVFWCKAPVRYIVEGLLIRGDHPHLRPPFNGHVAYGHALVHAHDRNRLPEKFHSVAHAKIRAVLSNQSQNHVFGIDSRLQMPVNFDAHAFGLFLPNRLSGEDVLHFTGANPESQRPKRSMGRRVGIPTDDGFPGLGQAHFRSHHVDDALAF